jgi:hypothetical protein
MTSGWLSGTRESSKILEQPSRQTNLSKDSLHDPRGRNFDLLSNLAAERKLVETPSHVRVPLRRHSQNSTEMCASLFDFSFPKILNRAVDRFPFSQNSKTNRGGGHVKLCHENSRMLPHRHAAR